MANFFFYLLFIFAFLTSCSKISLQEKKIRDHMNENLDDPSKFEFVNITGPDTFCLNDDNIDYEDSAAAAPAAHSASYSQIYSDNSIDSNEFNQNSELIPNCKIIYRLKYRYTIQKEKYLFLKSFVFDSLGQIKYAEKEELVNH